MIDKAWKRLEKEAVAGLDVKERKRLRKILRQIENNLSANEADLEADDPDTDDANSS